MSVLSLVVCTFIAVCFCPISAYPTTGQHVNINGIIVRVVRRNIWRLNKDVCPPSLCDVEPDKRIRGTNDKTPFYNGDIALDPGTVGIIFGDGRRKRALVRQKDRTWKNAIVPYEFHKFISHEAKKVFLKAMDHIQIKTCIQFRPRKPNEKHYIKFISEPGCWSHIGRIGGEQKLSLGRGCEFLGTAIHETVHALGLWHEQSRPDRDKYVKIVGKNIAPEYMKDFEKVNKTLINSRGFPYDYLSIMHYDRYAFTETGYDTIKVIGIGEKLKFDIGQRERLSELDVAQLQDLYRCPIKVDINKTDCPKGWKKFERICLKFVATSKLQFHDAAKYCQKQKSTLVALNSKKKEKFIVKYLNWKDSFNSTNIWRTGGTKIKGKWVWFKGTNKKAKRLKYKKWSKNHPGAYNSLAISRNKDYKIFKWEGVWGGTIAQMPAFSYPFICEKRAKRPCLKNKYRDGRDYRGKLHHTISGITCQRWSSKYPHQHTIEPKNGDQLEDAQGLGNHNYCRNPKQKRRTRPWCFTSKANKEWQFCDVTTCKKRKKT